MFSGVMKALGTDAEKTTVEIVFSECRAISIDYGIMEKADNVYVRCGDFGWSDVGTWGSVYQHARKDRYANAVPEEGCYVYDTRSSIVSLPKDKVAVISGLKEYIVVDTDDVLMICPRSEEQNIKKFIDEVKFHNGDKHIYASGPAARIYGIHMSELYDILRGGAPASRPTRRIGPKCLLTGPRRQPLPPPTHLQRRTRRRGRCWPSAATTLGDTLEALLAGTGARIPPRSPILAKVLV